MAGRIMFERLSCKPSYLAAPLGILNPGPSSDPDTLPQLLQAPQVQNINLTHSDERIYIRININDGIVAHPDCSFGPGSSCSLDEFLTIVKRKGEEVGDFREVYRSPENAKEEIDFLRA